MNNDLNENLEDSEVESDEKPKSKEFQLSKAEIAAGIGAAVILFSVFTSLIMSTESFAQWLYLSEQSGHLNTAAQEMDYFHNQNLRNSPEFMEFLIEVSRGYTLDSNGNVNQQDLLRFNEDGRIHHGWNLISLLDRVNPEFLTATLGISDILSNSAFRDYAANLNLNVSYGDELLESLIASGAIYNDLLAGVPIEEIDFEAYGYNPAVIASVMEDYDINEAYEDRDSDSYNVEWLIAYFVSLSSRRLESDANALSNTSFQASLPIAGGLSLSTLAALALGTLFTFRRNLTKSAQRFISEEDYKSRVKVDTSEVKKPQSKVIGNPLGWRRKRLEDKPLSDNIIDSGITNARKEEEQ